jgi:cytochrome c-type biogenesis protein CcmH/NrfG
MALRPEDTQPQLPKNGRKRMTPVRGIVLMVVAVAAAVGAALLLTRYSSVHFPHQGPRKAPGRP